MARRRAALDLNKPRDARTYIEIWLDEEMLRFEDHKSLLKATDEDFVRLAKQLFLHHDPRVAPESIEGPH